MLSISQLDDQRSLSNARGTKPESVLRYVLYCIYGSESSNRHREVGRESPRTHESLITVIGEKVSMLLVNIRSQDC